MARAVLLSSIYLLLSVEVKPQFFDFLGFPPIVQNAKYGTDYTTRRTKVDTIKTVEGPNSHITWKNTTISIVYEGIERDDAETRNSNNNKRKKTTVLSPSLFNFNFVTTTPKTVRKTKVTNNSSRTRTHNNNNNNKNNNIVSTEYSRLTDSRYTNNHRLTEINVELSKNRQDSNFFDRPVNNIQDYYYTERPHYEETTKTKAVYNNKYNYDYTTRNPYQNRPGVRPPVAENRPPITNRPATKRPFTRPETNYNRPETNFNRPETNNNRPVNNNNNNRPVTNNRPVGSRTTTNRPTVTVRPYIVNPYPTEQGALVFPHEDEVPEIIRGPDEDYMTDAEKRRHIEISERMCDKYKSLNTKHIQAIPLLPSPEPVNVNVSQCAPATAPLVVGGSIVSIAEFPHMALLGWIKLEGGGYSWKCGGSLISEQYVLTAAHCSFQERDNTVITGPPRVVQLGSSYLDDPGALVVRVAAVVRHPKYKFPKSYYDIALLKLVQKVTFSDVIKPACLGTPPPVGDPIIATGWGRTELGGDQSLELRSVSLPIWDMYKCHEVLGTSRKMPDGPSSDSQLCAGDMRGGKDTCQGDSGGPAQIQDGCAWRVVAVTSLGRSCGAPNTPGLYALVHRAFISAQIFGNHNRNNRDSDDRMNRSNREQHGTTGYEKHGTTNYGQQHGITNYGQQHGTGYGKLVTTNNGQQHGNGKPMTTENNGYYVNNGRTSDTNGQHHNNYGSLKHNERTNQENSNHNQHNYYSENNNNNNRREDSDNRHVNNNDDNNNRYYTNKNEYHVTSRPILSDRYEEGSIWFTK